MDINNPFVLQFVQAFQSEKNFFLVTEILTGGELLHALDTLGVVDQQQATSAQDAFAAQSMLQKSLDSAGKRGETASHHAYRCSCQCDLHSLAIP